MNMNMAKIRGVIFDVDGVLLDSMGIWTDLGARYLKSLGKEPEEDLGRTLFCMSMEQGAEYLNDHYQLNSSPEQVMEGLSTMLRNFYFYEVKAKPGALELLENVRAAGLKITAATSSPREHIERAFERNGILGYIERIFTNAEVGSSKHSPEIYNAAAQYMGTAAGETLVFEDSLYALQTASNAGYLTVGVFDAKGEADQESLRKISDIYITELKDFRIE